MTGATRWSYAAEIPLSTENKIPPKKRFRLLVKASVQQGEIGIGILSKDGKHFPLELRFDARADREQVSPEVDELEMMSAVIVRNTCPDNLPSKAVIEDIRLYYC